MSANSNKLRARRRSDYAYFQPYQTRWTDNDQYAHMNNAVYFHLIDSIVNMYLIAHCNLSPTTSPQRGLVVSSFCEYFAPVAYPKLLDLGLRVTKLGTSSVSYEVGIFVAGGSSEDTPCAVGGFTHVFVDRETRKSGALPAEVRHGLQKIRASDSDDGASTPPRGAARL